MKLQVDHIKETPTLVPIDQPAEQFPVLASLQADTVCSFTGPVSGTVSAVKEYDHLRVTGDLSVPARMECSRCLTSFGMALKARFTVIYRRDVSIPSADEAETELDEQALVSATYSGDNIDLSPEIGEQLAMELPLKPLCSEGCRGLCQTCGADLNQGQCGCDSRDFSLTFSALKDFKVQQR